MTVPERVVVVDASLRATQGVVRGGRLMLYRDRQRRKVQRRVDTARVLAGRHLEHALRRARRWMKKPCGRAPRHIAVFLAALHKVDPEGFKAAAREANG